MDGFRPGKVPMNVVAQRYGYSVHYEVMNDKVGEAFATAANEAKLRVAGQPQITEKEGAPEGQLAFDAVFEVYPEVKIGDLTTAEVEKAPPPTSATPPSTARWTSCASSAAPLPSAPRTRPPRTATASPSTSLARSTAKPSKAARPKASSSSSATARCSRNSKTPCVA
jgi:hypothetical protein